MASYLVEKGHSFEAPDEPQMQLPRLHVGPLGYYAADHHWTSRTHGESNVELL